MLFLNHQRLIYIADVFCCLLYYSPSYNLTVPSEL
nr:MAG TPA: hypothetical protein [Caudoviricetes sp.]